jgi:hypothetical protein
MMNRFDISKEDSAFLLASHLPRGRVWEGGFDSTKNFGMLIFAMSVEYYRLTVLCEELSTELNIRKTNDLLIEWEKSVGIPNEYFNNTESIERRRAQIEQLISNFGGVQTADDLVRVALFFGYDITVQAGRDVDGTPQLFPLPFPIPFSKTAREIGHTIYVNIVGDTGTTFPLPFPIPFATEAQKFLRLIFEILIPANVQLIFI